MQALMTAAFSEYPAEACLEYDRRFQQLAAKKQQEENEMGLLHLGYLHLHCASRQSLPVQGMGHTPFFSPLESKHYL